MNLETLKDSLPDFAKDTKLNLASVLTEEGAPGLSQKQIFSIAIAIAYSLKNKTLLQVIEEEANKYLEASEINGAKAAATIMAMNNVYYRFVHLSSDKSFATMPARLRMNVLKNHGTEQITFELCSLAVSALNACGMCIDAHVKELTTAGASKEAMQSAVRIASVLNSVTLQLP